MPNGNGREHMTEQNAYTMSQEAKKGSVDPSATAPEGHVLNNPKIYLPALPPKISPLPNTLLNKLSHSRG